MTINKNIEEKLEEHEALAKRTLSEDNIVSPEELKEEILEVYGKLSNSVKRTLGPGAGSGIITTLEHSLSVYPTKDGYTVIKEHKYNDQIKHFLAEIIKDIPKSMNFSVGDGTTSGLPIGFDLYESVSDYNLMETHPEFGCILPPISIRLILESIRTVLSDNLLNDNKYILRDLEREVENELIRKIATVSANNDYEIANTVADLFIKRESNFTSIYAEKGKGDVDEVNDEIGFEFGGGFILPSMANQPDRLSVEYDNPRFLMVDGPLATPDLPMLNNIISYVNDTLKLPLVVIARDYTQDVRNMLQLRSTRGYVQGEGNKLGHMHEQEPVVALTVNTDHTKSRDRLEDLRIILGGEIVPTRKGKIIDVSNNVSEIERFLGTAEHIQGTALSTRIKGGAGDRTSIEERIKDLRQRIKDLELNDSILAFTSTGDVRKRIAMLNSDMCVIKVGGLSDRERESRKLVYDDVILACQSAIEHGFTLGGNVSIPHIIKNKREDLVKQIVEDINSKGRHLVLGNNEKDVKVIVEDFLDMVSGAFKSAYSTVINNMVGENTPKANELIDLVYNSDSEYPVIFDLVRNQLNSSKDMTECDIIVPGNTDLELMKAIFAADGTLLSSNQMITIYPGHTSLFTSGSKVK